MIISRWILLRVTNLSGKSCRESQNTRFMFSNSPPGKLCRIWNTVEKYCRAGQPTDGNTVRRMRIACWMTEATDTQEYVIRTYSFSAVIVVTRTRLDITFVRTLPVSFYNLDDACLLCGTSCVYTGCPGRNGQNFGRVFLMLKYTDLTQNTYIQSWTVTEIMAREVWKYDSCYTLTDYQIHIKTGRNMWFL